MKIPPSGRPFLRLLGELFAFAGAYYAAARIGLLFEVSSEPLFIFWPQAALLLAALCLRPMREWLILIPAAFAAQLASAAGLEGSALSAGALWAARAVVEGAGGALLLRRVCGKVDMERVEHVLVVLLLPALIVYPLCALPQAAAGAGGLASFLRRWIALASPGSVSSILILPFFFSLSAGKAEWARLPASRRAEILIMIAVSAATASLSFFSRPREIFPAIVLLFVSYPVFLWAGMRSGPFFSAVVSLLMSFIGVIGMVRGSGGLVPLSPSVEERVLIFQLFATFLASVSLILSSAYARRARAETSLKASERRLKLIIDSMIDPLLILGPDGKPQFVSPAAERLTGFRPVEIASMSALALIHPDDRRRVSEAIASIMKRPGSSITLRFRQRVKKGGWVDIEAGCVNLLADPEIGGILANARDVSKAIRAEEETRAARAASEKAKEAAEKALEIKSAFLSNMSHEIRTPLTGILGMASLLSQTHLSNIQRVYVQHLNESGTLLLGIVNDILDLEMLESGVRKPRFEVVDVKRLCAGILDALEVAAAEKSIALTSFLDELPDCVETDPQMVSQILVNLIGNAVKFTERGSVKLTAGTLFVDESRVLLVFEVRDTGIGIPRDACDLIFERFRRLDSSYSKRHEGAGLGLSIVKRLIDVLRGTVSVHSEAGSGSVFTVRIPARIARAALEARKAPALSTAASDGMPGGGTLIVAEDNPINLLFIQSVLEKEGFRVLPAFNGHEVLELLRGELPAMILMDVQMPGMDGIECARAIRSHPDPRVRCLPIIALTGYAMGGDRGRCLEVGMDSFLSKPFNDADLLGLLRGRL